MSTESQESPEQPDRETVVAAETVDGERVPPTPEGPQEVDIESMPPHVYWNGLAVGSASRREITTDEFKSAGVEDQATVVWSRENDFRVPLSAFTEAALRVVAVQANMHFVNTQKTDDTAPPKQRKK